MSEFEDEYSAAIEREVDEIKGALFNDTIALLSPAPPVCVRAGATVHEAVEQMLTHHQACVLVVDEAGRLIGIFTERDVLTRVVGRDLNVRRTLVEAVMTANPEALPLPSRIVYAVHCMSVSGYRTLPLVDAEKRPIGVVTVTDIIHWLVNLFPEAVLNLRPGDVLKRPEQLDAG